MRRHHTDDDCGEHDNFSFMRMLTLPLRAAWMFVKVSMVCTIWLVLTVVVLTFAASSLASKAPSVETQPEATMCK